MTCELPRALAPWASLLGLFPADLALALGAWVRRLAVAVGPLERIGTDPEGVFAGYGGITRRGPYGRLLSSEWLLAHELPDEFLRRAAMGEHLFLDVARQRPAGGRRSVVLFDAGPSQHGSPRLVHLAALVVLARRAEAAGADFAWGVLQRPNCGLLGAVGRDSLKRLVDVRCPEEASAEDLSAWRDQLGTPGVPRVDDLWLIGGHRLATVPGAGALSRLEVADVLEIGAARVDVEVWLGRRRLGGLALERPDTATCVRLLREPFAAPVVRARAPSAALDPDGGLLFVGRRTVVVRQRDGGVLLARYPTGVSGRTVRFRSFLPPGGGTVLAAGCCERGYVVISAHADTLRVHRLGPNGGLVATQSLHGAAKTGFSRLDDTTALQPCGALEDTPTPAVIVPDAVGHVFSLGGHVGAPVALPYLLHALRRPPRPPVVHAIVRDIAGDPQGLARLVSFNRTPEVIRASEVPGPGSRAFFGYTGAVPLFYGVGEPPVCFHLPGARDLSPPWRSLVVGVASFFGPGILVLDADRMSLSFLGQLVARRWRPAAAPIACAAASPYEPVVGYLTREGELVIHPLEGHDVLLRRGAGGP